MCTLSKHQTLPVIDCTPITSRFITNFVACPLTSNIKGVRMRLCRRRIHNRLIKVFSILRTAPREPCTQVIRSMACQQTMSRLSVTFLMLFLGGLLWKDSNMLPVAAATALEPQHIDWRFARYQGGNKDIDTQEKVPHRLQACSASERLLSLHIFSC